MSPQGALTEYTYQAEPNYYRRGGSSGTLTQYTRGGHLTSIQYGWLLADAINGAGPAGGGEVHLRARCTTDALSSPERGGRRARGHRVIQRHELPWMCR